MADDKRTSDEDLVTELQGDELVRISVPDSDEPSGYRSAAAPAALFGGASGGGGGGVVNGGRLTLESGVPVSTTDQLAKTTIYWTPYRSNRVQLWDGSKWADFESAEISLGLGTLTNGLPYDVFMYEASGVPTLEFLAWTNASTRATALSLVDGRHVKSGDPTRLYLGTFHTATANTTEDSQTNRLLWNNYNRVRRRLYKGQTGGAASHNYNGNYRQWNGNGAEKVQFVVGLTEDTVDIAITGENGAGAGIYAITGAQLDGTSAPDTFAYCQGVAGFSASGPYSYLAAPGFHYIAALESSVATGNASFVNYFLLGSIFG